MRILVTGGAGFIGSQFVRALLKGEYRDCGLEPSKVLVLDALTYAGNLASLDEICTDQRYEFHHGDIVDESLLDELMRECDLVINFAAESHVDRSIDNPSTFIHTNILGVLNILRVARNNPGIRVIQVSTDEVYGSLDFGIWDEHSPLLPNSPYSASKASGDLLIRAFHKTFGLDVITTRCSNNYGPFQHTEKFIPLIITNLINGVDLPIYGNGSNIREWIHVSDHARAIAFLAQKGQSGEIYNIGTQNHYTNLDLAKTISNVFGKSNSKIKLVDDRPGHDFRYSLDASKISELGFSPKVDFMVGLGETIEWYRSKYA